MTEVVLTIMDDTKGRALLGFLAEMDFVKIHYEKKSKKASFPISTEDRDILKKRIQNAKENPETLLDSKQVLAKLETKLGKKIPVRSRSGK